MKPIRISINLLLAAGIAYMMASAFSTLFLIGGMAALGVSVSLSEAGYWIMRDMIGTTAYGAVILIGFALAFAVAAPLKKILPRLAPAAYPLAGAAAVAMALGLMIIVYDTVPIGGARSAPGFFAQLLAGAIGGWVFGWLQSLMPDTTGQA